MTRRIQCEIFDNLSFAHIRIVIHTLDFKCIKIVNVTPESVENVWGARTDGAPSRYIYIDLSCEQFAIDSSFYGS